MTADEVCLYLPVTWSLVTGMRSYISLLVLLGHNLSKLVLDSLEQIYLGNDLMNDIDLVRLKVIPKINGETLSSGGGGPISPT